MVDPMDDYHLIRVEIGQNDRYIVNGEGVLSAIVASDEKRIAH